MTHVTTAYSQAAYRFRTDDGSESGASWRETENTDEDSLLLDTVFRLRVAINETGGGSANNVTGSLQFSQNGGTYTTISGSTAVQLASSATVADATATTNQIGGSGTFRTGEFASTSNDAVASFSGNDHTEHEWCLLIDSAQASANDTFDFRVLQGGSTITYNVTPTATATVDPNPTDSGSLTSASGFVLTAEDTSPSDPSFSTVEDFEDGSLSEYTLPGTGAMSVVNASDLGGAWYLEANSTSSNTDELMLSTEKTIEGPARILARCRGAGNASGSVLVAVDGEDSGSFSAVECQWDHNGDIYLGEFSNGTWSEVVNVTGTAPPMGVELEWEILWTESGEFTLTLRSADGSTEYITATGSPTVSLTPTGIGFNAYHGTIDWDDIRVEIDAIVEEDAGSITTSTASSLTASEFLSTNDDGSVTASTGSVLTAPGSASATATPTLSGATGTALTASGTGVATTTPLTTDATVGVLAASDGTLAIETASIVAGSASSLTAVASDAANDTGSLTASSATPISATETSTASTTATPTDAVGASLTAPVVGVATTTPLTTDATVSALSAPGSALTTEPGSVTSTTASILTAEVGDAATDTGSLTASATSVLTAPETGVATTTPLTTDAAGSVLGASDGALAIETASIVGSTVSVLVASETVDEGDPDVTDPAGTTTTTATPLVSSASATSTVTATPTASNSPVLTASGSAITIENGSLPTASSTLLQAVTVGAIDATATPSTANTAILSPLEVGVGHETPGVIPAGAVALTAPGASTALDTPTVAGATVAPITATGFGEADARRRRASLANAENTASYDGRNTATYGGPNDTQVPGPNDADYT